LSPRLKKVQLLKRRIEGAVEVALVTGQQSETLPAIGESLKDPGETFFAGHFGELVVNVFGAARQLILSRLFSDSRETFLRARSIPSR
jgi:hypothetical protein